MRPTYTKKPFQRTPENLLEPILHHKGSILTLLKEMSRDYNDLSKSGSDFHWRLAFSKHAAMAKGLLMVLEACEAYPLKEDIL